MNGTCMIQNFDKLIVVGLIEETSRGGNILMNHSPFFKFVKLSLPPSNSLLSSFALYNIIMLATCTCKPYVIINIITGFIYN